VLDYYRDFDSRVVDAAQNSYLYSTSDGGHSWVKVEPKVAPEIQRRLFYNNPCMVYLHCKYALLEEEMLRKVFKTGNSMVISLPKDALELLGISEGSDVSLDLDREKKQVVISLVEEPLAIAGVDEAFAQQVAEFIDRYRPALEALAKA
jgi:antitoxin MazE